MTRPTFGDPTDIAKYILPELTPESAEVALLDAKNELKSLNDRWCEIEEEIEELNTELVNVQDEYHDQEKVVERLERELEEARSILAWRESEVAA